MMGDIPVRSTQHLPGLGCLGPAPAADHLYQGQAVHPSLHWVEIFTSWPRQRLFLCCRSSFPSWTGVSVFKSRTGFFSQAVRQLIMTVFTVVTSFEM